MSDRVAALRLVAGSYLAAFVAALVTMALLDSRPTLIQLAAADLVATVVVFGFSVRHDNSSFYDAYWSVIPIWLAGYLAWLGWDSGANTARSLLVLALVCAWGVRLTHNWARSWTGLDHEDWRYVGFREPCGRLYWPFSFLSFHLFPTVLVFLGCLPLVAAMTWEGRPLGLLDLVAALVTGGAVVLEGVADNQLRDFVRHRKRPGQTLREGVWAWSRHPNYLGEIGFWWGIWLFGVAAVGLEPLWLIGGAVAMTALFNFVSLPLIEARMARRRSDWDEVCAEVPRLLPLRLGRRARPRS